MEHYYHQRHIGEETKQNKKLKPNLCRQVVEGFNLITQVGEFMSDTGFFF